MKDSNTCFDPTDLTFHALEQNKELKKVVIVTSMPRYDSTDKDPLAIKEKLNRFGN